MSTEAPDKPPVEPAKPAGMILPRPVPRSWEGGSARFVLISAILLLAQPFLLAAQQVVSGLDIQVVDLSAHPSGSELASARDAYRKGHIVRIVDGTPQDLQRLLGVGTATVTGQNAVSQRDNRGYAKTLSTSSLQVQVVAARVDEAGVLHQYYGLSAPGSPDAGKWETRFNDWADHLRLGTLSDFPSPPQGAWTLLQSLTFSKSDSYGNLAQNTLKIFRLNVVASNPTNPPPDQYLVVEQPQSQPNWGGWNNCLVGCGWYTTSRGFTLASSSQAVLADHQPATQITTENAGFTIGAGASPTGPNVTASYTLNWQQPSVTTNDQSSLSLGYGQWSETFKGSTFGQNPPSTSLNAFYSYNGVVFQVPAGLAALFVNVQSDYNFENTSFDGGFRTVDSRLGFGASISVSPPQFLVSPTELSIPAGGQQSISVIASIPNSTQGLPWAISNVPSWLNVSQTSGGGSTELNLSVQPGTPDGSTGSLNIDTNPSFAAPPVETNPLIVTVRVGQPSPNYGVVLAGGNVQNASGDVIPLAVGEIYNVVNGQVSQGAMGYTRVQHTATLLQSGKILLAGGYGTPNDGGSESPDGLATAELFDPATSSFSAVNGAVTCPGSPGCMNSKRIGHSGTLLSNGQVLIAGGSSAFLGDATASSELFDPATGTFNAAANMTTPRMGHTATLLANGDVLLVGGENTFESVIGTAEIYHVSSGTFAPTAGNPNTARFLHTATLLPSGEVLIAGGFSPTEGNLNSAELFNPTTGTFTSIGNMNNARANATATLLNDGTVLIAGGFDANGNSLATAEIFNPGTQTFTLLSGSNPCPGSSGCLATARGFHAATLLPDGRVLLAGGEEKIVSSSGGTDLPLGSTEIYNPASHKFTPGATIVPAKSPTATLMQKLATTTTVESSANPSSIGQSVVFTAQVKSSATGKLTGTVTFNDGTTTLGTGTLSNNNQATFSTASLALGQHSITAVYSGDTGFQSSTSTSLIQTVGADTTSTTLVSSANPSAYQQAVTFTATVTSASGTPTGSVSFHDGGSTLGIVTLSGNQASLRTSSLSGGTHSISASYLGNNTFGGSTSPALPQVVQLEATSTSLSSAPNPSTQSQAVIFRASVTAKSGNPSGSITFHEGTTLLGKVSIANGQASLTLTNLTAGSHSIAATYSGDINFQSSTSPAVQQVVNAVMSTPVFSSLTPSQAIPFGTANINLAGLISAPGPVYPPANESVTVTIGSVQQHITIGAKGAISFNNFPTAALAAGTYTITYSYAGDSKFNSASDGSTTLTVNKITPAFSNLTGSQTITVGTASISLSGQIAAGRLFPTGSISISINGASTSAAIGSNGSFSVNFDTHAIPASTTPYPITYIYGGDSNFNAASNNATTILVVSSTKIKPTVTLVSSMNPSKLGQAVTFTVTVTSTEGGIPTGSITVSETQGTNSIIYGSSNLKNGVGTVTVAGSQPLTVGTHTLYGTYGGDETFDGATSPSLEQQVNQP